MRTLLSVCALSTLIAAGVALNAQATRFEPLPQRSGKPVETSGRVPHTQRDVEPVESIHQALVEFAFSLPDVREKPTIVSMRGAKGMWLDESVELQYPKAIPAGREFSHIHPDGSLHLPLPYERVLEVREKGWGESHPWATQREGWDGLVMVFTPLTTEHLETVTQLIVESYNHVTGRNLVMPDA